VDIIWSDPKVPAFAQEERLDEHWTPEEMDELEERLAGEEGKSHVRRLLRGPAVPPSTARVRFRKGDLTSELSAAYDALLDRTEEFARRTMHLPKRELKRFRRALALLQSGRGIEALAKDGDMLVKGLGVYEALLARSWAVRFDDPGEMCHLARVALEVAEHLPEEILGESAVKDYQASVNDHPIFPPLDHLKFPPPRWLCSLG
jgi:hypothetical protein